MSPNGAGKNFALGKGENPAGKMIRGGSGMEKEPLKAAYVITNHLGGAEKRGGQARKLFAWSRLGKVHHSTNGIVRARSRKILIGRRPCRRLILMQNRRKSS